MPTYFSRALFVSAVLTLASCGGGGSGEGTSSRETNSTITLSGSIFLPENSQVDSDTNDPEQAQRKPNDSIETAQELVTPMNLLGSVNLARQGPTKGANFKAGDQLDFYKVSLQAGQTIELTFTAPSDVNDLDLAVVDETGALIDSSTGTSSDECVQMASTRTVYVVVGAIAGASLYTLGISAPQDANSCPTGTASLVGMVSGQVIAKLKPPGRAATARSKSLAITDHVALAQVPAQPLPMLLNLPARGPARVAEMAQVSAMDRWSSEGTQRFLKLAAKPRQQPVLPRDVPGSLVVQDFFDTLAYIRRLKSTGLFEYVEPNHTAELSALVGPFPPDDPQYGHQRWHYEMINMPAAMERLSSLSSELTRRPLVAVIDSGIVADHPDLADQIVDQASFIDQVSTTSADDPASASDRASFHGTHTAGTVAALTFNGKGVAGVAPMAQLMPLRVVPKGTRTLSGFDAAQAILYAAGLPNISGRIAPRRADVINMSLGARGACPSVYRDVITQAINAGVIVVAASGNDGSQTVNAPANCTGVIAVGATDAKREVAHYSTKGTNLTVMAPGGDAKVSTTGTGLSDQITSTLGDFTEAGLRIPSYGLSQGTSMASPHVAGVMALMRYANPDIRVGDVLQLFEQGELTDDLGAQGFDTTYGWGLINARKAVDAAIALKGTPLPPIVGKVVAQPASMDFGAFRSSFDLSLAVTAATAETVLDITSTSPAVTVTPRTVDATTKLGLYAVSVDRKSLPVGSSFFTLKVSTTQTTFDVRVSVQKAAQGASARANFGRVYVLLIDADQPDSDLGIFAELGANAVNGAYTWEFKGEVPPRIQVVAGTDIDNDGYLCQRGEACGAYPYFNDSIPIVDITGNRTDLNFEVSPYAGGGVSALGSMAVRREWLRRPVKRSP